MSAVEFKDYYKVLGVARTATSDEIRKAFRGLARQYHPDVAKDKKQAEAKFKEINEAYEVLGDAEKRRRYDELGANWNANPQGRAGARPNGRSGPSSESFEFEFGGTGFSSFFEEFFGRRQNGFSGNGGRGGRMHRASVGQDIEGDLLVTLSEAVQGSIRTVSLKRVDPESGETDTQTLRVRIPAGVREGQLIRVAGQGEPGQGGGSPGDLYLRVRFERHPDFEFQGEHLNYELTLAPWEAVLGCQVRVPTLEGNVAMKVPAGSVSGQRLRLKEKGLPRGDGTRGDLYVNLNIQVPAQVSTEEKSLWEQLGAVSKYRPRET